MRRLVTLNPGESKKIDIVLLSELKKYSIEVACASVPSGSPASYTVRVVRAGEEQASYTRTTSQLDIFTFNMLPETHDMDLRRLESFYLEITNQDTVPLTFSITEIRDVTGVR